MIILSCPHCQSPFQVPPEYAGQQVQCPSCQALVATSAGTPEASGQEAPGQPAGASPLEQPPADPEPMASPLGMDGNMMPSMTPATAPASLPTGMSDATRKRIIIYSSIVVVVGIGLLLYQFVFRGNGGGTASARFDAYDQLKQAVVDKDYQAVYGMVDEDAQKLLQSRASSDPKAEKLEGAEKYATFMNNVQNNQRLKRIGMTVTKWMQDSKISSVEEKDGVATITVEYPDEKQEKIQAKQQGDQWVFEVKQSASRFYSVLTANYASEALGTGSLPGR